jgi:hypothetical protein
VAASQQTFLPQDPHVPSLSTTVIFHFPSTDMNVLPKQNPCYLLPPSTAWLFNYTRPITWTLFERLGISIHALRVSPFYKRPLY